MEKTKTRKTEAYKRIVANFKSSNRSNVDIISFYLDRISADFGVTKRFLICDLLQSGIEANETYQKKLPQYQKEFSSINLKK